MWVVNFTCKSANFGGSEFSFVRKTCGNPQLFLTVADCSLLIPGERPNDGSGGVRGTNSSHTALHACSCLSAELLSAQMCAAHGSRGPHDVRRAAQPGGNVGIHVIAASGESETRILRTVTIPDSSKRCQAIPNDDLAGIRVEPSQTRLSKASEIHHNSIR